jgi:hypothetical protein
MARVTKASPTSDLDSPLLVLVEGLARLVFWAGVVLALGSFGFLIYNYFVFTSDVPSAEQAKAAAANIELFKNGLIAGLVALGLSTAYLFWGEETLGPLQLITAAFLYFMPYYLPAIMGRSSTGDLAAVVLRHIQFAGLVGGVIATLVVVGDIITRVRLRASEGARAESLKYGKGIREERDIRNVFMGKCWQLPYCRKFVREKCPIYHSRRTCWKERVGCMCEESVIRNAMEGKSIPKDMVAAAQYIPRNSKLTPDQKAERCRQCVIYNEHQKHKYKLSLPIVLGSVILTYALFREQLTGALGSLIVQADRAFGAATYRADEAKGAVAQANRAGFGIFQEVLLVCLLLVAMAYLLKLIEYLFFKVKV